MFAPISAIFSLLFFASTLPNGIRVVELPAAGESVQILAGYTAGGLTGLASTAAGRSFLMDAYTAGATIEFINEPDRTALKIAAPTWSMPMLFDRLPAFFQEVPQLRDGEEGADPSPSDFKGKVEEEVRNALLGSRPRAAAHYATSDAFILVSAPVPNSLRNALTAIPRRGSMGQPAELPNRLPAERTLRFKSDLPTGAVIFASPIPGAHYKQWYLMLVLDRLIRRSVPLRVETTLPLSIHPSYYRVELAVPAGQFPEPAEESLLQELQRLQFTSAKATDLAAARQDALAYLDSSEVREWFATYDLLAGRDEGIQWIQSTSADDMRAAARDLLIMNRVIATWPPKPRQTTVSSEPLSTPGVALLAPSPSGRGLPEGQGEGPSPSLQVANPQSFPSHKDETVSTPPPERLPSGVSIAASTSTAVFVAGGPFTAFNRELTPDDLKPFEQYRPDGILVLAPASSLDRARQLWGAFKGNPSGEIGVFKGKVSSGDLPALFILKTIIDLKLIESGWSRDVSVRIDANHGSDLYIEASDERRAQVLNWLKNIIATPLPDAYFAWAREVAIHRFAGVRPHLQALTWERDPMGSIQDLETISARLVQNVAQLYF